MLSSLPLLTLRARAWKRVKPPIYFVPLISCWKLLENKLPLKAWEGGKLNTYHLAIKVIRDLKHSRTENVLLSTNYDVEW